MVGLGDIRQAVKPLRLIFWGGLLLFLDLAFSETVNGEGFRFDILNDTLGAVLVTIGVFRLARLGGTFVNPRFPAAMTFVKVVSVAGIVETAMKHYVFKHPEPLTWLLTVLGMAQLAGMVLFAVAMRWLCGAAGLAAVAASWRTTAILFLLILALPLGLMYVSALITSATGGSFYFNVGPTGLLAIPILLVPLVHFFVSTSRMRRAAEAAGAIDVPTGGFPVVLTQPHEQGTAPGRGPTA
jgi:hypothetical protein